MTIYKIKPIENPELDKLGFIIRREDNWQEGDPQSFIPKTEDNADYREYLEWVAKGNTPEPADEE